MQGERLGGSGEGKIELERRRGGERMKVRGERLGGRGGREGG